MRSIAKITVITGAKLAQVEKSIRALAALITQPRRKSVANTVILHRTNLSVCGLRGSVITF